MIKRVWINQFRNLKECRLSFEEYRHLYIYGRNNQGKTNFLESLFYLGNGKTPSTSDLELIIALDQLNAYLGADIELNDQSSRIYIKLDKINGRFITLDNTELKRATALKKQCPVIYLSADINREYTTTPDARRRSINYVLESVDPAYKQQLKQLSAMLRQKNALLKNEFNEELYTIYNQAICHSTPTLINKRIEYCNLLTDRLNPFLKEIYKEEFDSIEIKYKSRFIQNEEPYDHQLMTCITENQHKERYSKQSLYGPHRDDIEILFNGLNALQFASRGVGRTLSVVITLCNLLMIAEHSQLTLPVFLMDDTLAEIDDLIKQRILSIIQNHTQLVYCTTHNLDRRYFNNTAVMKIESGELVCEETC